MAGVASQVRTQDSGASPKLPDKVYIPVLASFGADGSLVPLRLRWEDETYRIDGVTDMRPAPALKAGGQGDRYTVKIKGRESFLFFERTDADSRIPGRWFVERRKAGARS
jgi:hypothetical protein